MIRDYQIVSPSLDGILRHDCVYYNGLKRPLEIAKLFDRSRNCRAFNQHDIGVLEWKRIGDYYHDLYEIFVKKVSEFVVKSNSAQDEAVKLQAMLQELIKVKKLLSNRE